MDLAKIRQKARQEQQVQNQVELPQTTFGLALSTASGNDVVPAPLPISHEPVSRTVTDIPEPVSSAVPVTGAFVQPAHHPNRPQVRDPLDVIVAGRLAAGCEEEQMLEPGAETPADVEEYLEYLSFRVSDETYGINIMDIKEIIKPREVTEVPRAPAFVSGVISLRGIIIPIIDMRERLGLSRETVTGRERVIVVRHGESFSGLHVDEIIQVVKIAAECLEAAPAVLDGIDRDFVNGIGRAQGRMIILLNLENVADIHLY